MKKILKFKKEWTLWIAALVLFLALAGYTIYALSFLAGKLNAVISDDLTKKQMIIRFDFEKLSQIVKGKSPGVSH